MVYRDGEKVTDKSNDEEEDDGSKSALIPKSLLSGKGVKPGDKIMLTVVHSYDEELEVKYAHSGKDKDKDKGDSESTSESQDEAVPDDDLEDLVADA